MKLDIKRPKDLGFLFVVGGPGGSGSSTIAKLLCRRFSLRLVYGGAIMRRIAKDNGFEDIEDFLKTLSLENSAKIDREIDKKLMEASYTENVLIESKVFAALAFKLQIPTTVSIWLDAKVEVRAKRKLKSEKNKTLEETKNDLEQRVKYDTERYSKLYNVDYSKIKEYNDIVIDTSNIDEYQTINIILKLIEDGGYIK